MADNEAKILQEYYAQTAESYDQMHLGEDPEHDFAMDVMIGLLRHLEVRTILDVGSGTGRVIMDVQQAMPEVRVVGLEPAEGLRKIGYQKGIPEDQLIDGDATAMDFKDGEFDLVCAFAVLHHIREPNRAVSEMLRVASKAVFISDANSFGQGSPIARCMKQTLRALGLWPVFDYIKTGGKGYRISDEDGLAYSYSVFDSYPMVRRASRTVHLINTRNASGVNPYRSASHVAMLGIK